jgi:hypothetical protein
MACTRFEIPSPCTICGSTRGALPASPNDASVIQCAICDQELGRLGDLKRELSEKARRCGRVPAPDVFRLTPAVTMRQ